MLLIVRMIMCLFAWQKRERDSLTPILTSHQNHWFLYDEKMPVESVTQAVSNLAIQFGDSDAENAMSRPFGVAMLFAGIDSKGPQLYFMDPSGTYIKCDAKAIGSGCEGASQALKESYYKVSISLRFLFSLNRLLDLTDTLSLHRASQRRKRLKWC